MAWILLLVLSLGCWALRLMEQAVQRQEFSRMLAGTLVAVAAGGVLATYFLMSDYLNYLSSGIDWSQNSIVEISDLTDPSLWLR